MHCLHVEAGDNHVDLCTVCRLDDLGDARRAAELGHRFIGVLACILVLPASESERVVK